MEKVPNFEKPSPALEQYKTPAVTAADVLFTALNNNDIHGRHVADLGCGTGIFAVGARVLGAKRVQAMDIDKGAVNSAKKFAAEYSLDIEFEVGDVADCSWECDTVIQNPPFGSQKRMADRKFLETAAKIGKIIYTIHNTKTVKFVRLISERLGLDVAFEKNYIFNLEHTFDFHRQNRANYEVTLFKLSRKNQE